MVTSTNFLFLPNIDVFQSVHNSIKKNSYPRLKPHQLFERCLCWRIDNSEILIYISPEMKKELEDEELIPKVVKRLSVYQIIKVYSDNVAGNYEISLVRLASILALETGKKIYIVSDDEQFRSRCPEDGLYGCIGSETAKVLIDELYIK